MILSVQYLRAIACLAVILLHITKKSSSSGLSDSYFYIGASGVDLFFIISGFIIACISTAESKPVEFLKSRFVRVYPIYWLCLIPYVVIFLIHPEIVNTHAKEAPSLLKSVTLYPFDGGLLNRVAWTLTYEIYFYLVFSLSFLIKGNKTLITTIIISFLFILGSIFKIDILGSPIVFEFVTGMLVYEMIFKKKVEINKWVSAIIFLTGIAGLVLMSSHEILGVGYDRLLLWGMPMLVIFTSLIMVESKIKKLPLLLYLGNASYITYLIHILVINGVYVTLTHLKISNVAIISLLAVAASVIIGCILHKYIESPMIKFLKNSFRTDVIQSNAGH